MRISKRSVATLLLMACGQRAHADPIYNVTRLGTGYSLQSNATGHVVGIRGSESGQVYTFDKVPVTKIPWSNGRVIDPLNLDMHYDDLTNGISTTGHITVHTTGPTAVHRPSQSNSNNSLDDISDIGGFEVATYHGIPVEDFNIRGDAVGADGNGGDSDGFFYNGFWHRVPRVSLKTVTSADGTVTHDVKIGLDHAALIPGFGAFEEFLQTALLIDDHGRILVNSLDHNGRTHYYLFVPNDLGGSSPGEILAAPVPEPSTLALFAAIGAAAVALRCRQRRGFD